MKSLGGIILIIFGVWWIRVLYKKYANAKMDLSEYEVLYAINQFGGALFAIVLGLILLLEIPIEG